MQINFYPHIEGLIKDTLQALFPVSDLVGLEWDPSIFISHKVPGDETAGTALWESVFQNGEFQP